MTYSYFPPYENGGKYEYLAYSRNLTYTTVYKFYHRKGYNKLKIVYFRKTNRNKKFNFLFQSHDKQWNVTPRIFEGGGRRYFFAAYFAPSFNLMLCLSVCLVILYCPYCLPPTSGGQAGNKEQDKQTNRA